MVSLSKASFSVLSDLSSLAFLVLILLEITGNKKLLKENLTKLLVRSFTTVRASFLLSLGLANILE